MGITSTFRRVSDFVVTPGDHLSSGRAAAREKGTIPDLQDLSLDAAVTELDDQYRRRGGRSIDPAGLERFSRVSAAAESYEVQWRLARAMFLLGDGSPDCFRLGINHGQTAAKLEPGRVEGHFWLGVNQALYAEHSRGLGAALLIVKARGHLKRAAMIRESYHGAGPLRVLGRLYHKAPWFLGGSSKRSLLRYERALSLDPANSVTLLYAAELAIATGDLNRAARLLQKVVDSPVNPDWEFENRRDKELARTLLAEIN